MLEFFFGSQGIILFEFIPQGQRVNRGMYINILSHLRDAVKRKHREKWRTTGFFCVTMHHIDQSWSSTLHTTI